MLSRGSRIPREEFWPLIICRRRVVSSTVHHDRVLHGRRLASSTDPGPYFFYNGNQTVQITSMALLHYANISVGTPSLSYVVALDTGSEMFWLPCNCSSCSKSLVSPDGKKINFNMYSPDASSTSSKVPCSSVLCELQDECPAKSNQCPYNVSYVSDQTSSAGLLVEDVLHLTTDDGQVQNDVAARITFGCSMDQTGLFLHGGPLNGLMGLGMGNLSVPSILAKDGLTSNSFSMCFGPDGLGRINFGDKGSSDQGETPFIPEEFYPVYHINITQINVGGVGTDLNFTAIFDSGSSFTHLMDPAYTIISRSFNSQSKHKRLPFDPTMPFEYCYAISPNETDIANTVPTVNLTMKGGHHFVAFNATIDGGNLYCLAIVRSENLSIIGQHFMTGYRVVFDREKMVLGWKASDCYNPEKSNSSLPINPGSNTVAVSPAVAVDPGVTRGTPVGSPISGASPPLLNDSSRHLFPSHGFNINGRGNHCCIIPFELWILRVGRFFKFCFILVLLQLHSSGSAGWELRPLENHSVLGFMCPILDCLMNLLSQSIRDYSYFV